MAKKAKLGKTPTMGNKKDGARPSTKHQVSGKTKGTAVNPGSRMQGRAARVAKMERMDPSC